MPLNKILPPSIVFSESTVLNSSSVLVVWSEAEAASSYGVVVNRVVGGGATSRVARITVSWWSLYCLYSPVYTRPLIRVGIRYAFV